MSVHRFGALTAAAVSGVLLLAGCGNSGDQQDAAAPPVATETAEPTAAPSEPAGAEPNEADVMFAQMMVPHHAQAIEMSDMVLAKDGVDPRVTELAEEIKAAQGPEIEQMTGWLEEWGEDAPAMDGSGAGGMDHSSGMMGESDMQALADADGAAASRLFLEQMIAHHRGAIEMAETQVAQGHHPDAVALARDVVDAQQAEIAEMEQLLATL